MNFIVSAFLAKSAAVSSGGVPVGLIVTLVIIAALVIAIAVAVYKIKKRNKTNFKNYVRYGFLCTGN